MADKYYIGKTVFNTLKMQNETVIGFDENARTVKTNDGDGFVSDYDDVYIIGMSLQEIERKYHAIKCNTCRLLAIQRELHGDYQNLSFTNHYGNTEQVYPYYCPDCGNKLFEGELV